ncbi:chalcone isomerase family protein [Accumulibacter sp.]|uniref:chalcone isomerase family protein n=1 Tax=Accumulibacter sp. TaxID=2053492 RepID=UPI0025EEAE20|nr:chalcone isomerase family protein [Accumulibacter sp.]MCM8594180.1 chalcone isomerase family protein [Accumulibacter sp.]MCM8625742.1 chalcone isomerase family protein [Accumulibacter sp.]MDS4048323.1 chalcone isomerase family protein [Accumulibacter sp.]
MKRAWLALCLTVWSAVVQAVPDALRDAGASWRQWGSGEMRWLGIPLYRATLWVAGAARSGDPGDSPHAVQLDYRREITRSRLVEVSVDEMRRLGASEEQLERWKGVLGRVFPDVRDGDTLFGVHYPGWGATFYDRQRLLGEVPDADFARYFFSIWLDPRTRNPGLRAALLERPPG